MKNVKYVGWYIDELDDSIYTGNTPAKFKIRYIVKELEQLNAHIEIFLLATKKKKEIYRTVYFQSGGHQVVYSVGVNIENKIGCIINNILKEIMSIFYTLQEVANAILRAKIYSEKYCHDILNASDSELIYF